MVRVSSIAAVGMVLGLAVGAGAQGATFYVSTTGSDSNNGSLAAPWRTVQKAASTLVAGETAVLRGGTYRELAIRFSNSGTPSAPITLRAYPGETPTIDGGYTASAGMSPVFNIDAVSHVTLDGLKVTRGSAANILISENTGATAITIVNCTLTDVVTDDNAASIYLNSRSHQIVVKGNRIYGRILGGRYHTVGSGVILFNAHDVTIENNEMYNLVHGIYYKHSDSVPHTSVVRNNVLHDMASTGIQWSRRDSLISHNLIYAAGEAGIRIFDESATCDRLVSSGNQVEHNTIVDTWVGVWLQKTSRCVGAVNTIVRDNVIAHFTSNEYRGVSVHPYFTPDTSATRLEKNLVYSALYPAEVRVGNTNFDVASLPTTVAASGNIGTAPSFRNVAIDDYALVGGAGKGGASDGTDMGADICRVGVSPSCTPTGLTAPRNLRITGH